MPRELDTTTARVVVIGGGIVGVSILYHLAKAGWKERSPLTAAVSRDEGKTWTNARNVEDDPISPDPAIRRAAIDATRPTASPRCDLAL